MLTYTSKNGHIYDLSSVGDSEFILDSYGAITQAADDGDVNGLKVLLRTCPYEYRGRCDALNSAAEQGNLPLLKVILANKVWGEENIAYEIAISAGHKEVARELANVILKLQQERESNRK